MAVPKKQIRPRAPNGRYQPLRPQPLGELVEALGGRDAVAQAYRVTPTSVCSWRSGKTPWWLTPAWRGAATAHGLDEAEQFLAAREAEQTWRRSVQAYIAAAVLFGLWGRWYLRGGGYVLEPPEPPQELTDRQVEIVRSHLERHGRTLLRDHAKLIVGITGSRTHHGAPIIDAVRAAKLQGFVPVNPNHDAARYATWLRQRSKISG